MSAPFLIIDGYNLLHAAGFARCRYGPRDLERARRRLLVLLAEKLDPEERRRCTIVYDAQDAAGDAPRADEHHGIAVQFAAPGQDADAVIESHIEHHSAPRRLIVVSSDHRLHKAARRRGASPVDSESFLQQLERRESISPLVEDQVFHPPASARPPSGSADDWPTIFGDIDVRAIEQEVGQEPQIESLRPDRPSADRLESLQRQLDDPRWVEEWLNEPIVPRRK
jgi:predicted RNA-binding protein with PIN domain